MFLLNNIIDFPRQKPLPNLQYKMFLLNDYALKYDYTEKEYLQYKMFLLNALDKYIHSNESEHLQYKMFLLNEYDYEDLKNPNQIYNTKCFY